MKISELISRIQEDYPNINNELKITEVFCFLNGNVAVFDQNEQQVGFLQGLLSQVKINTQDSKGG